MWTSVPEAQNEHIIGTCFSMIFTLHLRCTFFPALYCYDGAAAPCRRAGCQQTAYELGLNLFHQDPGDFLRPPVRHVKLTGWRRLTVVVKAAVGHDCEDGALTLIGGSMLADPPPVQPARARPPRRDIIMSILLIRISWAVDHSVLPLSIRTEEMTVSVGWAQGIGDVKGGSSEMLSGGTDLPRTSGAGNDDLPLSSRSPAWSTSGARRLSILPGGIRR